MRELLVATSNKGKLKEILSILDGVPFAVLSLSDVGLDSIEEPAETLEGNALIKAFIYGKHSGMLTLADDTGLEVDALGGGPGVRTARYADGDDTARNEKLLRELADVSDSERGARFRTVAAIYDPATDKVRTFEGECVGSIAREYRGTNGFGFSPLFEVRENGKTLAEMEMEELHGVNHRSKAFLKAKEILLKEFV
jgi:XTP/dITP diphosphohydrolase